MRTTAIMACPAIKFYNRASAMRQRFSQRAIRIVLRCMLVAGSLFAATVATLSLRALIPMCDFLFFIVAVTISAWYGDPAYGLFAALLSVLSIDYFLDRQPLHFDLARADLLRLALFLASSLVITSLGALNRRKIRELEQANLSLRHELEQSQPLEPLLPICATCRKIRDRAGDWTSIEDYLRAHAQVQFTHGLCTACISLQFPEQQ